MGEALAFGAFLAPDELPDDPAILLPAVSDWLETVLGNADPGAVAAFAYAMPLEGPCPRPSLAESWTRAGAAELHHRGRLLDVLRAQGYPDTADRMAELGTSSMIPIMLVGPRGHVVFAVAKVHPLAPGGDA